MAPPLQPNVRDRFKARMAKETISIEVSEEALTALRAALDRAASEFAAAQGGILPEDAWALCNGGQAVLLDIRTAEERKFVGHPPGSAHIAWMQGSAMVRNPRFLRELEATINKDSLVLLICRSGKRSAAAVEAARAAGFQYAYNVLGGFEGDLDENQRRGSRNGWRHAGLPWIQD